LEFLANMVREFLEAENLDVAMGVPVEKIVIELKVCGGLSQSVYRFVLNPHAPGRPCRQALGIPAKGLGNGRSNLMLFE